MLTYEEYKKEAGSLIKSIDESKEEPKEVEQLEALEVQYPEFKQRFYKEMKEAWEKEDKEEWEREVRVYKELMEDLQNPA